ncbi:hypothetical protein RD792_007879 [Penstemon davidsonii]|uniref:Uncharacterized protein n=1 Tax=Penstemon davidsonii TaxID=160366 RepID=A0ABR0D8B4_9LAMI|nr:hypothetical protein RD792_007879 [Penstemon davidsonii]
MRMRNNEYPACRTHCSSRRSLRDDPNNDSLIAAMYLHIDKYEEEVELIFFFLFLFDYERIAGIHLEEEKARNKQVAAHGPLETNRELLGATFGFLDSSEIPAWRSGGISSDTRQCSPSEATDELSKNNGVSKPMESLGSALEYDVAANTKE